VIHWAPGLPKTRSGKIMRRILRKIAEDNFDQLGDTSHAGRPRRRAESRRGEGPHGLIIVRAQKNVQVLLAQATAVSLDAKTVTLAQGAMSYDYLVLATGATHSYFGHTHWQDHAPGLKTIEDALEMRRRILLAFEEAEQESDDAARQAKLTFVIVGAGPTGVELAGAIKEIAAQSIPRDFPLHRHHHHAGDPAGRGRPRAAGDVGAIIDPRAGRPRNHGRRSPTVGQGDERG
jgi:hypothetical protein